MGIGIDNGRFDQGLAGWSTSQVGGAASPGTVTIVGAASYLEIDEDGVPKAGISGRNAEPGDVVTLEAAGALRIRVGNAAGVRLTINGIDLPSMGAVSAVVEWSIVRVP